MKAHPGFKAASASIAKREGISGDRADAILASASRNASAKAKKANPRLNRVKGKAKKGKPKAPPAKSRIAAAMGY